jgi:hypothetical protein
MSAGGTMILAGLGGAAGVYGAVVFSEEARIHGDPITIAAIGGAAGAALGTLIGLAITSADKKTGTLSGPPAAPLPLRFP